MKSMATNAFLLTFALAAFATAAMVPVNCVATTILVPSEQPTIKQGIDKAVKGDTVLVAAGIYDGELNRDLDLRGVNMTLISESGPESTIIDCGQVSRAFYIHSTEDTTTMISGFTIRSGSEAFGGAVRITNSSPKFIDCVFSDNSATGDGGAMYCEAFASPVIRYCSFITNSATDGGAVFMSDSEGEIRNCAFTHNQATSGGAVYISTLSTPLLDACIFENNTASSGGAIYTFLSEALVSNCTIINNVATSGGGLYVYGVYGPTVENCTIVDNSGHGIYCQLSEPVINNCIIAFNSDEAVDCTPDADPATGNCVVFANSEGDSLCGSYADNLFVDPLLCNIYSGNVSLCSNSPCLPANNSWGTLVGSLGQGCGDCEAAVEPSGWGEIKQLFR
jgi:parallel beta-helix repeat protein/predicted outer membrane repeat protein